jgi:TRAP-type transport system small permease protein
MAPRRGERVFEHVLRALAYGGGAVLLGLMAMVVYEVVMRRVFSLPFLGSFEITELAMVLIVALGLPYCAMTGGHVAVDVFAPALDRPRLRWVTVAVHLAGAGLLAAVAWRTTLYAMGSYRWGDATNMMAIPKYPFQLVTATGAALFALVLLLQAWKAAFPRPPSDPAP